jgi:hypothetical protein
VVLLQVFFVSVVIFLHNHNSMAYVHSTIVYSMEAPIGWAQSSRTTVRAVTISQNTAGAPVTRAAMTATTTTTTVGTQASAKHLAGLPQFKRSVASSWLGHYYGLPAHDKTAAASRADAVAATADVPLPEGRLEGNTELHSQPQTEAAQQQQSEPDYGAAAEAASDASEDGDYTITVSRQHLLSVGCSSRQ